MARSEYEREDLLRQATALVERAELQLAGHEEPVFIGFRSGGEASFFFGASRVYHFNSACELRRAYLDGVLYKAERGRLVALRRVRSDQEVALARRDLTESETADLAAALREELTRLQSALQQGQYAVVGQVPLHGSVVERVRQWLTALPAVFSIAQHPRLN